MNYYNPYFMMTPAASQGAGLSSLFGRINIPNILNGAQKTLGLINQALPLIKEAAPMMRNAKTMFKVMNEFKKIDAPSSPNNNTKHNNTKHTQDIVNNISEITTSSNPTFFL